MFRSLVHKLIMALRSAISIKFFVFCGIASVSSRIDLLRLLLPFQTSMNIVLILTICYLNLSSTILTRHTASNIFSVDSKTQQLCCKIFENKTDNCFIVQADGIIRNKIYSFDEKPF